MSNYDDERRPVFKKGKGRAFLKFLIGELLLIGVACFVYLFILQGDVSAFLPAATPAPTDVPATEVPATATPAPTPAPTAVVTIAPTEAPTPEPSATPVPFEEISLPMGEDAPELPVMPDGRLKLGMSECRAFNDAGQNVLLLKGHAYIEGLDAAKSSMYIRVEDVMGGFIALYPATSAPETANLSFEESSGTNLSNAFFTARIDISEYAEGPYMISAVVVNEDQIMVNYFDNSTFHFVFDDGVLSIPE